MEVFLRICIFLALVAVLMVVITMFEFKDNHLTYRKPEYNSQPLDNDSNTDRRPSESNNLLNK